MERPKERGRKRSLSASMGDMEKEAREVFENYQGCAAELQGWNGKRDDGPEPLDSELLTIKGHPERSEGKGTVDVSDTTIQIIAKANSNTENEANRTGASDVKKQRITKEAAVTGEISTEPILPGDIISCILEKLIPSSGQLVPLRMLNRQCNTAIQQIMLDNPELPSLLLPSSEEIIFHSTTECEWDEDQVLPVPCQWYPLRVPWYVKKSRFCGACDGNWVYLQLERSYNVGLFNICTGQTIPLPRTLDLSCQYKQFPVVTVQAMAASWLSATEVRVVAAIVESDCTGDTIALWRDKSQHWEHVVCPNDCYDPLQDVIFFNSGFYFMTLKRLGLVTPVIEEDGHVWGNWKEAEHREYDSSHPMAREGTFSTRRYLVESEGELFCVSKLLDIEDNQNRKLKFTVYKLINNYKTFDESDRSSSEEDQEEEQEEDDVDDDDDEEEDEQEEDDVDEEEQEEDDVDDNDEEEEDEEEEDDVDEEEQEEEQEEDDVDDDDDDDEEEEEDEQEEDDVDEEKQEEDDVDEEKQEEEQEEDDVDEEEEDPQCWMWVDASWRLHHRTIFVGQGCSRSYPSQIKEARIYFFDDNCLQLEGGPPVEFLRDSMGFISITETMEYDVPTIRPLVGNHPLPQLTSDKCAPSWWFH